MMITKKLETARLDRHDLIRIILLQHYHHII